MPLPELFRFYKVEEVQTSEHLMPFIRVSFIDFETRGSSWQ